ncbi:MAG TPA: PAS domain-containing sensor histidine kinase [Chroococcales cyanobacterium]|jgi:PAS domain S-box-containing protein
MTSLLNKLLAPHHEYLTLDRDLIVLETSCRAKRFADCPEQLILGNDVRASFPELIGIEDILLDILLGQRTSFELKGIARSRQEESLLHSASLSDRAEEFNAWSDDRRPSNTELSTLNPPLLYFDLYISQYQEDSENRLIILLEDVTETMVLQQILSQRINEANLLLSSLTASKNYINRVVTSMADALLVTTASGVVKTINQSAQQLFGYSQDELIQKPISLILPNQDFLQEINNLAESNSGELLKDREVICQTKTGDKIFVAFSCSVIQTEIDGLQNLVYIGRDISERKRVEAEMLTALERERELRELKSNFISMASHEFRTPLTAIFSSSELLQYYGSNWSEDKKLKYYQRIEGAVKRMAKLLDDVLLYSKVEAGKLEFNPKPIVLEKFCQDLIEEIQLGIDEKPTITFIYSGPCDKVCLDEKLLQHILNNLLTNAIKYSPQDTPICFSCSCENGEIIFEIQDEGIGIPLEDQRRLFESFHRAKNVGSIPGTGLGLAIVQKAVELHGGTVTFTSEVGIGTTFRVALPLN